jgi:hypothetical protein
MRIIKESTKRRYHQLIEKIPIGDKPVGTLSGIMERQRRWKPYSNF